jgi:hypothetical protein
MSIQTFPPDTELSLARPGIRSHHGRMRRLYSIFLVALLGPAGPAVRAAEAFDFASPASLTGTIYEAGSHRQKVLFTFQRAAVRAGDTVRVERKFFLPDGALAADEDITYAAGRLVSYRLQELQAGIGARIDITNRLQNSAGPKIAIGYAHDFSPPPGNWQNLLPDTLIDDTVYPFLLEHWDALLRGEPAKFRFVALEHGKLVSFRLVKAGESTVAGRPVVLLKMEPANFFVARFVNPLLFTVEKDAPRRVLSYFGGTTPRVKKGNTWKYLDAETVFDWK